MSVELTTTVISMVATILAIAVSSTTLFYGLRKPITRLEERLDVFESRVDARFEKVDERFDRLEREMQEFRLETRTSLARHDERLAAIERIRPQLITP